MATPLVSVICLCYNQGRFVAEAIESVLQQSYSNLQIIVVDDFSSDNSVVEIEKLVRDNPSIEFIPLKENHGNCKAFNIAWKKTTGVYVIDFACDDIMLPDRVRNQVEFFQTLDESYGVIYSDATYIDENGNFLYKHMENLRAKKLIDEAPVGDIYEKVISRYFISSPTMMIRNDVLISLNGYDEVLAYEDFDFWVRSSRHYKYAFQPDQLTKVRKSSKSMSTGWYRIGDTQLHSTYLICRKIIQLNRNHSEKESLIKRVRYEIRQSVLSENRKEANLFFALLKELVPPTLSDNVFKLLSHIPLPFSRLRRLFR